MTFDLKDTAWGLDISPSELTMQQIEKWSETAFNRKKKIDSLEEALSTEKEALNEILEALRQALNHFQKNKYVSSFGNVEIRRRHSVRTPKTPEEKKAFFEWLQAKGIFWEYATVNSNSLNSLVKAELESSPESKIPGIGEPFEFQTVVLRKG